MSSGCWLRLRRPCVCAPAGVTALGEERRASKQALHDEVGRQIELKVSDKKSFAVTDAESFADQDLQYAVGNNSRFGAVVVLDVSEKAAVPAGIGADIGFLYRSGTPSRAVLLVAVRGCLPAPSSHSA